MNIDELRELRVELERRMEYCPPDDAPPGAFEIAERAAIAAGERYDEMAPGFALLDAVDGLADRLDALEQEMVVCRRCFDNAAGERAAIADRVKENTAKITYLATHLAIRLDELEAQAEHEWKARQLADDGNSASIGALETELNGLRNIILTLSRLAEIEKPSRVVLTPDGEWVQGDGLLPAGAFDGDREGGEEHE